MHLLMSRQAANCRLQPVHINLTQTAHPPARLPHRTSLWQVTLPALACTDANLQRDNLQAALHATQRRANNGVCFAHYRY